MDVNTIVGLRCMKIACHVLIVDTISRRKINMDFKELLPYIVSVLLAFISFITSYLLAGKKTKDSIKELEKQHDMRIVELEKQHEQTKELLEKQTQNDLTKMMTEKMMDSLMNSPEVKQQMNQYVKQNPINRGKKGKKK